MVTVRVIFFARCRDITGTEEDELILADEPSVKMAVERLAEKYPRLKEMLDRSLLAVNEEFATLTTRLREGDTLAILPPVSGGSEDDLCEITREPIDPSGVIKRLLRDEDGAVVTFEGVVRNHSMGKTVLHLEYEAYEPMALKMMRQIAEEVHQKWPIDRIGIVHRLGRLSIGETSVLIVVTSAHRREAFEACHYAIDRLKKIVPIWKREYFEDGVVWVEGEGRFPAEGSPS
ncbi:MAG TPA: molybdenum cofactor biosynthesis protein MoaE [Blastocatellia bacterium]|nr:molybdenum cofactor biosynthesis protein MoaE [Blastocatellia bacterium]